MVRATFYLNFEVGTSEWFDPGTICSPTTDRAFVFGGLLSGARISTQMNV